MDLALEHASHSGDCSVTGRPIMFGLFTLDKDEGVRESNSSQNRAHFERLQHFSKFGI